MGTVKKITLIAVVSVIGMSSAAWWWREPLFLFAAGKAIERRTPVGPPREIAWSTPETSSQSVTQAAAVQRPPNIVLIVADDLGWNDITLNGGLADATVPTPNIDAIAQQGVNFTHGYAGNATCAPSRAAMLSGRYSTRFGFEFTPTPSGMSDLMTTFLAADEHRLRGPVVNPNAEAIPFDDMGMPTSEVTIAELLAEQGYHNIHIGKWHLGRAAGMRSEDQGFDESLMMMSGLYLPEGDPDGVNARQDFDPIDRFLWAVMQYAVSFAGEVFAPDGYLTDYFTTHAERAIAANRDRPFFLYLAHWAPHSPLQALREDYDALAHIPNHRQRVYGAMVRSLDRGVGRVLDALERHGISDNTLVLFTSDNGAPGYIGLPDVNQPYRGWKTTFFEGGLRVPMLARWPAQITPGTVYHQPVQHFDLFTTIASATGARVPDDRVIDGVNLLRFINSGPNNGHPTRGLEGQLNHGIESQRQAARDDALDRETQEVPHRALFWRSGVTQAALIDGWKLIVSDPPGRSWLFNLAEDPTEQRDLSTQHPDKTAALSAALAQHNAQQQPPLWPSQLAIPVNIDNDLSVPDQPDDTFIYWSN